MQYLGILGDLRPDLCAVFLNRVRSGQKTTFTTGTFHPFDPTKPIVQFDNVADASRATFSPNGRMVIYSVPNYLPQLPGTYQTENTILCDAATGTVMLKIDHCWPQTSRVSDDGKIFITFRSVPNPLPGSLPVIERYSIQSGKLLSSLSLPGISYAVDFSPDGCMAIALTRRVMPTFSCFDLATSRPLSQRPFSGKTEIGFFPDGRKLIAAAPDTRDLAIYYPDRPDPIAILPQTPGFISLRRISPDGRTIALMDDHDVVHLYHPTGPDCPESTLGLFAFPHTALLLALLIAAALSLRHDAARHAPPHAHHLLSLLLLLATLPRTYHFLLAAALGHLLLTPAPLLLLSAIALRTGATLWRWTAFTLLTLQLPLNLLCLHHLRKQSLPASTPIPLDRTWHIPNLPLLLALALLTFAILPALYHLARPARPA